MATCLTPEKSDTAPISTSDIAMDCCNPASLSCGDKNAENGTCIEPMDCCNPSSHDECGGNKNPDNGIADKNVDTGNCIAEEETTGDCSTSNGDKSSDGSRSTERERSPRRINTSSSSSTMPLDYEQSSKALAGILSLTYNI